MKIGDKVRFLSEVGGGKVVGFKPNHIVVVEDNDGFDIPVQDNDVVVIESDNYETSRIVAAKKKANQENKDADTSNKSIKSLISGVQDEDEEEEDDDPSDKEMTYKHSVMERDGGNKLSAYLAFVPVDIKEITSTRFESYLVNDSNYYFSYSYMSAEGNSWKIRKEGTIEPNTKELLENFGRENLEEIAHVAVQIIAFKKDKSFLIKPVIDVKFRIDGVKFYKLHVFEDNDFFETPALIYTIVENDEKVQTLEVNPQKMKEEMYAKQEEKPMKFSAKKVKANEPLVIDLHIDSLLDNTDGMKPVDILNYQLDKFREVLKENAKQTGKKIIFIHGKGDGVLRHAVVNELHYKYKDYSYQDASFKEYGYGATQVTIK